MNALPLSLMTVAREISLDDGALDLLRDDLSQRSAVRALLDNGDAPAALRLALRLMPRGYVVPWVCQCVRGEALDAEDHEGLRIAETWLRERTEPSRRAALHFAASQHYVGTGALLAASAGWSEGFLLDGEGRDVAPVAPQLLAVAAAAALLTLVSGSPDFADRCRQFAIAAMALLSPEDIP
ncbi:hypothetical protein FHW69_002776 [Luteibacter sp. Sphag1AF]|uniref:DUF6931 family protein n=1 Tax=Luteibacter sp. Sphag1AF TaxID=2587031 RepID=UPI0016093CA7|nr:hypothetical protein [Luteibacter sp. Sphag1AF]MBB3228141.1 hypothetical protein [Luteibacter sp. Sphag1AF]